MGTKQGTSTRGLSAQPARKWPKEFDRAYFSSPNAAPQPDWDSLDEVARKEYLILEGLSKQDAAKEKRAAKALAKRSVDEAKKLRRAVKAIGREEQAPAKQAIRALELALAQEKPELTYFVGLAMFQDLGVEEKTLVKTKAVSTWLRYMDAMRPVSAESDGVQYTKAQLAKHRLRVEDRRKVALAGTYLYYARV